MEILSPTIPPPVHRLKWLGWTDPGRVRKNNEDTYLCLQFDAQELRYLGRIGEDTTSQSDFVFAVSDGMGGEKAGEFASRIAADKITRLMPAAFKQKAAGLASGFEDIFEELYQQIHRALMYLGNSDPDCKGMGATLSLCWFTPGWMYYAHIGDSRIYYLPAKGGGLKQLTEDDTHVGWLYRHGKITERQAREHPGRSSLQRALGAGHQFVDPQVGAVGYEVGDRFLLCTDGLVDGLNHEQIEDRLKPGYQADMPLGLAQFFVKEAVERSGRDNTTALFIEIANM